MRCVIIYGGLKDSTKYGNVQRGVPDVEEEEEAHLTE